MKDDPSDTHILVIDIQPYWRQLCTQILRDAGFSAQDCADYQTARLLKEEADFIILSCTKIGPDEQELITQFLREKYYLLLFCAYLPPSIIRYLYLEGVDAVADKTYDPVVLLHQVQTALSSISSFRENARLVEGKT